MADFTDIIKDNISLPGLDTITIAVIIFLGVIACGALVGFLIYWWLRNKKYSKWVIIYQKVNGRYEPMIKSRAAIIRISKSGDTAMHILKTKQWVPTPQFQTGRGTYWFFERQDLELINFAPGDFDLDALEMGARLVDKEMRYARTELEDKLKDRGSKESWLAQHWKDIASWITLIVVMIFLFLLIREIVAAKAGNDAVAIKLADAVDKLVSLADVTNNSQSYIIYVRNPTITDNGGFT